MCVYRCVQVRRKPALPEQNNDNVDDDVAADIVWKQSRLREDSIVRDLFSVRFPLISYSHDRTIVRYTHTHPFNGPFSGTTQVSWYQKGETNLDFTEARDSEWQWHQLDYMQVCTLLQTDNHASTPPLCFLQSGCPFCRPTNNYCTRLTDSLFFGTTWVSQYQKGKTSLDLNEARDGRILGWQWHQLDHT